MICTYFKLNHVFCIWDDLFSIFYQQNFSQSEDLFNIYSQDKFQRRPFHVPSPYLQESQIALVLNKTVSWRMEGQEPLRKNLLTQL